MSDDRMADSELVDAFEMYVKQGELSKAMGVRERIIERMASVSTEKKDSEVQMIIRDATILMAGMFAGQWAGLDDTDVDFNVSAAIRYAMSIRANVRDAVWDG